MNARATWQGLVAAALLCALPSGSFAATKKSQAKAKPDTRTVGIGHSCKKRSDCLSRAQVCLKEADANGKELPNGVCALPCVPIESQKMTALEATAPDASDAGDSGAPPKKKPIPPRCPKKYQCRSAGVGVPIDLCIKE